MEDEPTIEDLYDALGSRGNVVVTRHRETSRRPEVHWSALLMPHTLSGAVLSFPDAPTQREALWGLLQRCWDQEAQ